MSFAAPLRRANPVVSPPGFAQLPHNASSRFPETSEPEEMLNVDREENAPDARRLGFPGSIHIVKLS
jgi:hypothetical protein